MRPETDLLAVQRRFMAALREPIFGESRERTDLLPRTGVLSDAFVATAEDVIAPSPTLEPVERLELYHRQYWYRLLDSIAEDFPGLRAILGDEAFWQLMESYLEATPSTSFTLRHLGQSLAGFIAEHPHLVPYPLHAQDMARLEYAIIMVFEAAEHAPIPPVDLACAPVGLQPHLHLLELRAAVDDIWHRVNEDQPVGRPDPPSEHAVRFVAVYRQNFEIKIERIPRAAYAILRAINETSTLDEAMERVAGDEGLVHEVDPARVSEWFNTWVSRGWLTAKTNDLSPHGARRGRK